MRFPRTRNTTLTQLLAVLVAVCLIVKPLVVALHLAHHEHTGALLAGAGGHCHDDGHEHGHEHPDHHDDDAAALPLEDSLRASGDDSDHPPHPASDHDDRVKIRVATGGPQPPTECGLAVSHWDPVVVPQVVRTQTRFRPATGPPRTDQRTELLATTLLLI